MPIAFHPEPESDHDVDGERTGGAGAADHSNGAGDPEASPHSEPPRRDPLTERILSRGDASVSAVTYDSETDGEQYDLADRQALRRVAGLSTELEDVTEVEYRQLRLERVVLAGLYTSGNAEEAEVSLRELAALAETAGSEVLDGILQRRAHPDPGYVPGQGKAAELADLVAAKGADTVIIDGELGPGQRRAPRGRRQGEGHRPHRPDPGHLRPARRSPGRARHRSSSPNSSTCCRACAAGASRCPGRRAVRSAERERHRLARPR